MTQTYPRPGILAYMLAMTVWPVLTLTRAVVSPTLVVYEPLRVHVPFGAVFDPIRTCERGDVYAYPAHAYVD
jgi:hypothetical protein